MTTGWQKENLWESAPVVPDDFHDPGRRIPVTVVGAHGGAGTSTVARLIGAADLGRSWPQPADGQPPRVLVVARTHAAGLMAVSQVLAGCFAAGCPEGTYLAGVVLVADAPGRLPKPLARRVTVLASAVMMYRIPWVNAWRLLEVAADPATVARLATGLRRFAEQAALASTPSLPGNTGGFTCSSTSSSSRSITF